MTQRNIVWLQTSFLGDIVLTTGAMGVCHGLRPEWKQYLITTSIGAAALEDHPYLEKSVIFHKREMSLLKAVREIKQQLADCAKETTVLLQPHKSFRSSLLAKMLGFRTITYCESSGAVLSDEQVPRVSMFHEAVRIALLLEPLGIRREEILAAKPKLFPLPSSHKSLNLFNDAHKVAMAPGSVWGTKKWPKEKYKQLAATIMEKSESVLVLLGSKAELSDCGYIEDSLGDYKERIINLCGETSLSELRAVYPHLDLVVANDSSAIHYAAAFEVPTVAIFGATVPEMGFGPLSPDCSVVETQNLECRPCSDHGPKVCPLGHFRCMNSISVEKVWDHCVPYMRSPASPSPGRM